MTAPTTSNAASTAEEEIPEIGPRVSTEKLKSILESLIFVADRPMTLKRLARAARSTMAEVQPLLDELMEDYASRGVHLYYVAGGYQFRSAKDNSDYVKSFIAPKPVRLSRAQLETLAIVAYRQPITRPEIDDVRGVDSGSALRVLAERGLLKILGRKNEPGRPLLYGTTPRFLEFFGLSSLEDLPTLQEFSELTDESRTLFEMRTGESIDMVAAELEAKEAEAEAQEELLAQELEATSAGQLEALDDDEEDDDVESSDAAVARDRDDDDDDDFEDDDDEDDFEDDDDEDE